MKQLIPILFLLLCVQEVAAQKAFRYNKYKGSDGKTQTCFSHNQKYLLYDNKNKLYVTSGHAKEAFMKLKSKKGRITSFSPLPDTSVIVICSGGREIQAIVLEDHREIREKSIQSLFKTEERLLEVHGVNSRYFLGVDAKGEVHLYDLRKKEKQWSYNANKKYVRGVSVDPTGKLVAIGGSDGVVDVIDVSKGSLLKQINVGNSWVLATAFDLEGKKIAIGTDQGLMKVVEILSGVELSTFSNKGRILQLGFAPDNKYIGILYDKGTLRFFDSEKNKGDYVLQKTTKTANKFTFNPSGEFVLVNAERGSSFYEWGIHALNIKPIQKYRNENDKEPPSIYLTSPARIVDNKAVTTVSLFAITGTVVDNEGVFELKVNNKSVPTKENGNFVINIPLAMGINKINIEALDVNGNVSIKRFDLERRAMSGEEVDTAEAKNYLLAIGVNDYAHWPSLNNAVRDAREVAKTLLSDYTFERKDMVMLLDSHATKHGMYNALRDLVGKVTPNDNVLIYYAGHGYFDDLLNEGYWVPYEAREYAQSDYFSNTELFNILKNINSKHTFLVVDACFSGALFASRTRGYSDNVEKYKSRWALTSGRLETVEDGAYGENSPFADSFITFLKENKDKDAAVSDVVQYVKKNTVVKANQTPMGNPLQQLGDEGGEFIFHRRK